MHIALDVTEPEAYLKCMQRSMKTSNVSLAEGDGDTFFVPSCAPQVWVSPHK